MHPRGRWRPHGQHNLQLCCGYLSPLASVLPGLTAELCLPRLGRSSWHVTCAHLMWRQDTAYPIPHGPGQGVPSLNSAALGVWLLTLGPSHSSLFLNSLKSREPFAFIIAAGIFSLMYQECFLRSFYWELVMLPFLNFSSHLKNYFFNVSSSFYKQTLIHVQLGSRRVERSDQCSLTEWCRMDKKVALVLLPVHFKHLKKGINRQNASFFL